jgi:hypothetical protein
MIRKLISYITAWWAEFPYNGFSKDPAEREEELAEWQTY